MTLLSVDDQKLLQIPSPKYQINKITIAPCFSCSVLVRPTVLSKVLSVLPEKEITRRSRFKQEKPPTTNTSFVSHLPSLLLDYCTTTHPSTSFNISLVAIHHHREDNYHISTYNRLVFASDQSLPFWARPHPPPLLPISPKLQSVFRKAAPRQAKQALTVIPSSSHHSLHPNSIISPTTTTTRTPKINNRANLAFRISRTLEHQHQQHHHIH